MIAIVDYGMGNRRSVEKALHHVGAAAAITRDPAAIRSADGVVVPGVGAFPAAMAALDELGLVELLRERAAAGVPLLGICLGMQLLFERSSEHGGAAGLGLLRGDVTQLDAHGGRLPHIGWNLVSLQRPARLTEGLGSVDGGPTGGRDVVSAGGDGDGRGPRHPRVAFYHVHSLVCRPADPDDVVGTAEHGERFATLVERDNVFGVQFHPEKSSLDGLALLRNFSLVCAPVNA